MNELSYCPYCNQKIEIGSEKCPYCQRIFTSMKKRVYEPGYALIRQDFGLIKIVSVTLTFLMVLLCSYPFLNRNVYILQSFDEGTIPLFVITLIIILSLWQISFVSKYLLNFYHPFSKIFTNIRWEMVAIIFFLLLGISTIIVDTLNNSELQSGMLMYKDMIGHQNMQIITSLFIATYVFWVFVHAITGWTLADSRKLDFVGGLPYLGYILLASAIIPLFIVFVPMFVTNIFFKAGEYSKKYGFLT